MAEYIFEIDGALYNDENQEVVMKPEYKGRLVRCRDCIHSYVLEPWEGTNATRYCKTLKNHYGDSDMWVEDNDYCSYGERKEDHDGP